MRIHALAGSGLIGIATTKKIGSRPRRNFARRRVIEGLRTNVECLTAGLDYVVVIFESSIRASFTELCDELFKLIHEVSAKWAERSESF